MAINKNNNKNSFNKPTFLKNKKFIKKNPFYKNKANKDKPTSYNKWVFKNLYHNKLKLNFLIYKLVLKKNKIKKFKIKLKNNKLKIKQIKIELKKINKTIFELNLKRLLNKFTTSDKLNLIQLKKNRKIKLKKLKKQFKLKRINKFKLKKLKFKTFIKIKFIRKKIKRIKLKNSQLKFPHWKRIWKSFEIKKFAWKNPRWARKWKKIRIKIDQTFPYFTKKKYEYNSKVNMSDRHLIHHDNTNRWLGFKIRPIIKTSFYDDTLPYMYLKLNRPTKKFFNSTLKYKKLNKLNYSNSFFDKFDKLANKKYTSIIKKFFKQNQFSNTRIQMVLKLLKNQCQFFNNDKYIKLKNIILILFKKPNLKLLHYMQLKNFTKYVKLLGRTQNSFLIFLHLWLKNEKLLRNLTIYFINLIKFQRTTFSRKQNRKIRLIKKLLLNKVENFGIRLLKSIVSSDSKIKNIGKGVELLSLKLYNQFNTKQVKKLILPKWHRIFKTRLYKSNSQLLTKCLNKKIDSWEVVSKKQRWLNYRLLERLPLLKYKIKIKRRVPLTKYKKLIYNKNKFLIKKLKLHIKELINNNTVIKPNKNLIKITKILPSLNNVYYKQTLKNKLQKNILITTNFFKKSLMAYRKWKKIADNFIIFQNANKKIFNKPMFDLIKQENLFKGGLHIQKLILNKFFARIKKLKIQKGNYISSLLKLNKINYFKNISIKPLFFNNNLQLLLKNKINTNNIKLINAKYSKVMLKIKFKKNIKKQQQKINSKSLLIKKFKKFFAYPSPRLLQNKFIGTNNSNTLLKNLLLTQIKQFKNKYKIKPFAHKMVVNSIDISYFNELLNKWTKQGKLYQKLRLKHRRLRRQQKRWFKWPALYRHIRFKTFFKYSLTRFRKISKHRFFNSLLKGHFKWFMGIGEKEFFKEWKPFRRLYDKPLQSGAITNIVSHFTQALNFRLSELAMQFKFTNSIYMSRNIAYHNIFVLNGESKTKKVIKPSVQSQLLAFFKPKDILQINIMALHTITKNFVLGRNLILSGWKNIKKISYLQTIPSMMMLGMVFWPRDYEFKARTFYTSRWIRYWIWNLPSKSGRYLRLAKSHWNLYPKRKFNGEEKIRPVRQRR